MSSFTVIIEHDLYSRKPININFKVRLLDSEGFTVHSICFKERIFDLGMFMANRRKKYLERPAVQFGFLAASLSEKIGFEVDTSKGIEEFVDSVIEHSSTEILKEVLKNIKSEKSQEYIKSELTMRGEINNEKAICVGSN